MVARSPLDCAARNAVVPTSRPNAAARANLCRMISPPSEIVASRPAAAPDIFLTFVSGHALDSPIGLDRIERIGQTVEIVCCRIHVRGRSNGFLDTEPLQ